MNGGKITRLSVRAYSVPTLSEAETDGTARWDSTGVLIVEVEVGGKTGLGYAYADAAAAGIIQLTLWPLIQDQNPLDTARHFWTMAGGVRNLRFPPRSVLIQS